MPGWPPRGFATITAARNRVQGFVVGHNTEHRHGVIRFVAPISATAARRRRC